MHRRNGPRPIAAAVEREFLNLDQEEQSVRSVMAKMESDLIGAWRSFMMRNENKERERSECVQPGGRREGGAQAQGAEAITQGVWFGLGMMGLVGWSVVVPTLLGAAFGIWLDKHHPGKLSWTLALLVAGLAIGCLNAWHWVEQGRQGDERRSP
jgi:predicted F0F1-ATPase subunit